VITLLCIGDLHLRSGPHLEDVRRCLDFAAKLADERQVHGVLLAGDIFEGKSSEEERDIFGDALADLSVDGHGQPRHVLVVKGNHDRPLDLEVYAGYPHVTVMERPGIVALGHSRSTTTVDVLCCPWPERAFLAANGFAGEQADQAGSAALAAMLRAMVATREHPERPLVVLAHLQVLGAISSSAQPLVGRSIEIALGELQDLGAAAIVLGHVHRPQELAPNIHYIGSFTCHDFGEQGEQKRVGILTIDDAGTASWEWVSVPCRRWLTVEAEIGEDGPPVEDWPTVTTAADEEAVIAGGMEALAAGSCVRYVYRCDETNESLFDHATITRRFAAAHTLKIEPRVERAARVRSAEVAAARTALQKLEAWGQATGTEITPALVEKLHALESEVANV